MTIVTISINRIWEEEDVCVQFWDNNLGDFGKEMELCDELEKSKVLCDEDN